MSIEENGYKEIQLGPKKVKIPIEWDSILIGDVASLQSGNGFKSKDFKEKGIPLIKISNVQSGKVSTIEDQDYLPPSYQSDYSNFLLDKDDLLIALSGATTGKMGFVGKDVLPAFLNQRVGRLKINGSKVDKKFIGYYLTQKKIKDYIFVNAQASAQQNISPKFVEGIRACLPPFSEQKKIAEVLSTVDDAIQKTEEIIERSKELKKGLMQDLLTKGIGYEEFKEVQLGPRKETVPNNWETKKLGDIAKVKRGASPRPISADKYFGGDVGWIRISDVGNAGKFLNRTKQYLSELGVSKSVQVYPDEIIMSICATVGKPCIVKIQACIHDGIVAFKDLHQSIDINFLYYTLQKNRTRLQTKGQTGTQSNLNSGIVRCFKVLLPPLPEQKRIANILSKVDKKIQKEKDYKEKLEKLKKGLMQDLLTGKIRVLSLLSDEEKEELTEANVPG